MANNGRQWHENGNRRSSDSQSEKVNEKGSHNCSHCSDRNDRANRNQPPRLPDRPVPALSHDLLESYLIGQQKTSQFLIGQKSASIKPQDYLIGQLQNESNDGSTILESEKGQSLTEHVEKLNLEEFKSETDQNKSSKDAEETNCHTVCPSSVNPAVNNSHFSQANCESDLSYGKVGDKNVNKQRFRGENLHLEPSTAVKGDTVINNNPCSDNNLSLINKPLSAVKVKSKCLPFGHVRHSFSEDKFSTPGWKLNNDTANNTGSALQQSNRSSTFEFNEEKTLRKLNEEKTLRNTYEVFERAKVLKHEISDLSSYYTARSDFGSDFYGLSASSFVTCQEFLTPGPKSRFTKAKEFFLQGGKYVKAKFSNYQKRLRNNQRSSRHGKCGATCGFPCFFLSREVSQFSFGIPECSLVRGTNPSNIEGKGGYSKSNNDLSEDEEEFFTGDNFTMSENDGLLESHVIIQVTNGHGVVDGCHGLDNRPTDSSLKQEGSNVQYGMADGVNGQTADDIMTIKLKPEPGPGSSVDGSPVAGESSVDREPGQVTMATTEAHDDLPVGTEAGTIITEQREGILRSENDGEQKPTNKRLRWVSAMDKTQSSSLHSSTTSNSSVEQFLSDREMDPEKMLKSLGFGFSPDTDLSCGRIPDRFLLSPSSADGIDMYKFVLHHPDLHHLLWMWDKNTDNQSASGANNQSTGKKSGNWGRSQTSFASVLHGMKFIHSAQSEVESHRPKPTDKNSNNIKDISQINSVLDLPNRLYLASQGYYGNEYMDKDGGIQEKEKEENKGTPKPVNAAQRRKQFLQSSKSKNWSLTSEPEDDVSFTDSSSGSVDHGLLLRSFSEGLSIGSESSMEEGELFGEDDRRNSISNLRRQYQETIRQSIDREFPVFSGPNKSPVSSETLLEKDKTDNVSERRKREVDRLMASLEDDGDYFAQSRQSSIKEVETIKLKHKPSKDSTLTSPMTPKTLDFSFEKEDGQHFQFSTPVGLHDLKQKQEISIIVEDETDSKSNEMSDLDSESDISDGEIIKDVKTSTLGLSPLALMKVRSDSSHTLVSQDSNFDTDSLSGDLTPRPGDVSPQILENSDIFINEKQSGESLSESASSSGTLNTMLPCDRDHEGRSRSSTQVSMTREESDQGDRLQPTLVHMPQESFELEEILSADNGMDGVSNYSRPPGRRGVIEKSASTHSDSSGFADLDLESAGEPVHSNLDLQQDNLSVDAARLGSSAKNRHDKTMTVPPLILHDNRNTQDALHLLPVSKRKQTDSRFRPNQMSVINNDKNKNFHVCSIRQKLSPSRSDVPSLTSISYRTTDSEPDNKSLVYTLSVPYNGESSRSLSDLRSRSGHEGRRKLPKRKFVSTMNINVTTRNSQDGTNKHSVFSSEGHTKYHELNDLEPSDAYSYDTDFGRTNDSHSRIQNLSGLNTYPRQSAKNRHDDDIDLLPSNRMRSNFAQNGVTLKQRLNYERRSKEVLASAKRQMVDWLLSNQRLNTESQHSEPLGQYAHPLSMSTPSLKMKQTHNKHLLSNRNSLERHSFDYRELRSDVPQSVLIERDKYERKSFDLEDLLNDAELRDADSRPSAMSSRDSENKNPQGQIHEDFRCDSSITSGDEYGGVQNRGSLIESSLGMAEEHLEYLKLARLVNGPSNLTGPGVPKLPAVNYRPMVPLKHWTDLRRNKHLEEETRLMQHAIQRYKTELSVMETMLFKTCQLAVSELSKEERADLEELQCLWSEVRKELNKLEEHLSFRLSSVLSGNDNFSPLSAMEIVSSMIDLLREQLYQQQLCITRDVSYDGDDLDLLVQSPDSDVTSVSTSEQAVSEFSHQISYLRDTITRTQLQQQEDLSKSFSDLRDALMAEVHSEMNSNTKWLQLQLQSKDNEIQRLRTELFLQNLQSGTTRKRQYFESDV